MYLVGFFGPLRSAALTCVVAVYYSTATVLPAVSSSLSCIHFLCILLYIDFTWRQCTFWGDVIWGGMCSSNVLCLRVLKVILMNEDIFGRYTTSNANFLFVSVIVCISGSRQRTCCDGMRCIQCHCHLIPRGTITGGTANKS